LNPKGLLHTLIGKIPKWLLVLLALAGFYYFSHGFTVSTGTTLGYVEEIVHQVGPLQAGRVKEIVVALGQPVKTGDVLVRMDSRPLDLQKAKVLAELAQLRAQVLAEEDLHASLLMRGQIQAVRAYASVQSMRAELRETNKQLKRLQSLKSRQLVRADEVEVAQKQKSSLSADLGSRPSGNVRDQELMGLRPRPKEDQDRRLHDRLEPYRIAIGVKEAELAQLEFQLSELVLKSPVDGIVGPLLQRQGDVIGAGTPVLQIITHRPGFLVAFVPERQIQRFTKGQKVALRRPRLVSQTLYARVLDLGPQVEEMPVRSRPTPGVPAWGRRVILKLETTQELVPGESFRVTPE